jgi:signal transduction histidine kinase
LIFLSWEIFQGRYFILNHLCPHLGKDDLEIFFSNLLKEHLTTLVKKENFVFPGHLAGKEFKMNLLLEGEKLILITGILNKTSNKGLLWESLLSRGSSSFSPLIEKITGFRSEEINEKTGRGFNLLKVEEAERMKSLINNFRLPKKSDELELVYKITDSNGKEIWIQEHIFCDRDSEGNILNSEVTVTDLSPFINEKQLFEEMLSNMRELNKSKDQFISVLSHDLKSPYTSILGFSEILINESSLSQEERSEYLSYINISSQKQLKLINNLLEWSRLVTGRKKIEPVKVNLKNLINGVISHNTRNILKKNLELRITADNYIHVEADETLLIEVMNIFISNAVKYSNPGNLIEICINRFKEKQYEVIVRDEGTGISDKNKNRLLKIDQVFSSPGTSGERGSGMSLLLAQEIIRNHSGELWYYSDEGKGSEFHFTLPAAANMILLVENDEDERLKIRNMLKTSFPAFSLRTEGNSYDALKIIEKEHPAFVITSHKLPLMNGIEFIKALKKDDRHFLTPVIAYSEEISDKLKEEYKSVGVTGLFSKPVDLKQLKEIIEENLR